MLITLDVLICPLKSPSLQKKETKKCLHGNIRWSNDIYTLTIINSSITNEQQKWMVKRHTPSHKTSCINGCICI